MKLRKQRARITEKYFSREEQELVENGKEVLYLRAKLVKNNVFGQE